MLTGCVWPSHWMFLSGSQELGFLFPFVCQLGDISGALKNWWWRELGQRFLSFWHLMKQPRGQGYSCWGKPLHSIIRDIWATILCVKHEYEAKFILDFHSFIDLFLQQIYLRVRLCSGFWRYHGGQICCPRGASLLLANRL